MADDTEERSCLAELRSREDFRGFKESMQLYALEKGDVEGIFSDNGSDPSVGYQSIRNDARRREWMVLSGKLTGRVGRQIINPTLRNTWNTAMAGAVADGKTEYRFAVAMEALEKACGGIEETAKQIARTGFKVALMSFEEQTGKDDGKAGFINYADGIRVAEQKLAHAGVEMTDDEKKEKFYGAFSPRSANWNAVKMVWRQSANLTFGDILAHGIQEQQSLHAVEAENNASEVRSFNTTLEEEREHDRLTKRIKRDEETASETKNLESSTNHDTRKITADFENVRKQLVGFKQMLDDGLIDEGEFKALKTKMLGLQDERV